jgi:glycine hydroxymethyltransferase
MLVDKDVRDAVKQTPKQLYHVVESVGHRPQTSEEYHKGISDVLRQEDVDIYRLIIKEYERLQNSLQLIAAENLCSRAVLAALGSVVQNKTTEGFVGARFHGGCKIVDELEKLAVARAKQAFGAKYANVQPHSGTSANQIVITAILKRARVSFAGKFFDVEHYYVDKKTFLLDYDAIRDKARQVRPKLIICGASAYSRVIDFKKFRQIADEVGTYLLADISHIAGLVIAGAHPSPVDYAHFSTTSTYKPGGPRGGLILMGKDYNQKIRLGSRFMELWELIEQTTFPGIQGTPYLNNIAAKAVFFKETLSDEYQARQFKIIENAKSLADALLRLGYDVLTSGTDNHMVLINVGNLREGLTGLIAQNCLEDCGIIINKNRLPYDKRSAMVTSGIRLGTPIVTKNGMGPEEMECISALIDTALKEVKITTKGEYDIEHSIRNEVIGNVKELCGRFPNALSFAFT